MLARTSAHKYEVEACFELKGENTSAGLVAYYDENYHFGFGFNHKQMLRYRRGQVSVRNQNYLKQTNVERCGYVCGMMLMYCRPGTVPMVKNGISIHGGFEISGVHHNTVYGFLFVRPGIFAGGDGQVEVTDFVLRNLD